MISNSQVNYPPTAKLMLAKGFPSYDGIRAGLIFTEGHQFPSVKIKY